MSCCSYIKKEFFGIFSMNERMSASEAADIGERTGVADNERTNVGWLRNEAANFDECLGPSQTSPKASPGEGPVREDEAHWPPAARQDQSFKF